MASFPLLACLSSRAKVLQKCFPDGDDLSDAFREYSERAAACFQRQLATVDGTISHMQAEALIATLGPDGMYIKSGVYTQIIEAIKKRSPELNSSLPGEPQLAVPSTAPEPAHAPAEIEFHGSAKQVNFYVHNYLSMSIWQGLRTEYAIKEVLFMTTVKFLAIMGMVNVSEMQWPYLEAMIRWAAQVDIGNQLGNVKLLKNTTTQRETHAPPRLPAPLVYPGDPLALRQPHRPLFDQLYTFEESPPRAPPAELSIQDLRFLQRLTPARVMKLPSMKHQGQLMSQPMTSHMWQPIPNLQILNAGF